MPLSRILLVALGFLVAGLSPAPAHAAQQLVQVYDLAAPELQIWWKRGDLMLVMPGMDGQEARRPLADGSIHPAPAAFQGWTRLGAACESSVGARITFPLADKPAVAAAGGDASIPVVTVHRDGVLVAQAPLGQPARPCQIHVGEADALPGVEIIVSWMLGSLRGVTVFRLPELAH